MARVLRFGVVGNGVIGAYHIKAIRGLRGEAELAGVADIDPARSVLMQDELGVPAYTDYRELLARPDIDVINVCTPSGLHEEVVIAAMRAGKDVLCEKPLEINAAAIDRILAAQRETGRKLAGMFQRRACASFQGVKRAAENGDFGRLTFTIAEMPLWRSQSYYDSGDWRGTWALDGGGCLMNQGIHTIDLMQWIMGPVVEISATTATVAHERIEVEDVAMASVRFANGALGTICMSTAVYPGLPLRLVIGGDRGAAILTDNDLTYFHSKGDGPEAGSYGGLADANQVQQVLARWPADQFAPDSVVPGAELQQRVLLDLIAAIRENRDPMVTGEEARKAVDIILAVYESARTGRPVRI